MNKELIHDIYDKITGISDLDWIEIVEKNKLDCHPDTLRKAGVGIKMAAEAGVLNLYNSSSNAYDDLYKAKKQFYDQRREYNKLLANDAKWDHVYSELIKAAKSLNKTDSLFKQDRDIDALYRKKCDRDAVLVLGDWHYGLVSDNVWNKYDKDIAKARIQKLRNDVMYKLSENHIKTLHVVILGDMISGGIHNSIKAKNCEDVVEQLMEVSELIAHLVSNLSRCVFNVKIYSTWGNHARLTANINDSVHSDNLERIIPFWLSQRFKNGFDTDEEGSIEVVDSNCKEIIRVCACGHEICGVHGDIDTPNTNPMLNLALLYRKLFDKDLEVLVTGHFHHISANEAMNVTWLGVSSLCGTDEYAKDKRLFAKPSQMLLIFDEEGLDSIHNIDLSNAG